MCWELKFALDAQVLDLAKTFSHPESIPALGRNPFLGVPGGPREDRADADSQTDGQDCTASCEKAAAHSLTDML